MSLASVAETLVRSVRGPVEEGRPLGPLTTYRVGGPAAVFVEVADEDDLVTTASVVHEAGCELLVLGRGSNVVVSDRGFDGVVVKLGPGFTKIDASDDERATAGAATPLPVLANWAARRSLAGAEFMVSIPGSVGGGVRMNAGAHGGQISDVLVEARLLSLRAGSVVTRYATDLDLSYRHSNLTDGDIVIDASFRFSRSDADAIRLKMEENRAHRAATQPGALQNAGSTFKNPPGDAAGRLVESVGLKGFRVGGVEVSSLHANFFIASDEATSQDVFDLIHEVRRRVHEATGVVLEPEVRFVGTFEERSVAPEVQHG